MAVSSQCHRPLSAIEFAFLCSITSERSQMIMRYYSMSMSIQYASQQGQESRQSNQSIGPQGTNYQVG